MRRAPSLRAAPSVGAIYGVLFMLLMEPRNGAYSRSS